MNVLLRALKPLVKRPAHALIVIAMLAVGIGATTAVFSLFHQILMQPLPVPEPERLVNLAAPGPKYGSNWSSMALGDGRGTFSYPMFRELEAEQRVFTGLAGHRDFQANIGYGGRTVSGRGLLVSGEYFDVLRLQPALGRLIGPQDEPRIDEGAVAVLSHDYWESQFGRDPNVVGRTLTVNGQSLAIIGVAPEGFTGTAIAWRPQVFVPLTMRWLMQPTAGRDPENGRTYWLYLFTRLNPGVTVEQASAQLNGIYAAILRDVEAPMLTRVSGNDLEQYLARRITFEPGARGQRPISSTAAEPLTLLLGVTGVVLLIVCVNVANLLLARGAARASEMAVRASIGASRGRLLSQLLGESAALALIGGLVSVPLAAITLRLIVNAIPEPVVPGLDAALSVPALLFAAAAALATVILFGVAPAWQASAVNPIRAMKGESARTSGGESVVRLRGLLMTAQIAFSMVLLVLAGLFTQSLANVSRIDLGMNTESLVSFGVSPRLNGYEPERVGALYDRIEEALEALPGVAGVSSAAIPPLNEAMLGYNVSGRGFEYAPGRDNFSANNRIGAEFFSTLSIPIRAGRDFTDEDRIGSPRVAIVNESFLRKFPLGAGVGEHFSVPFVIEDLEIVGIVADATYAGVKDDVPPVFYTPRKQDTDLGMLFYYVRGAVDAEALMRTIPRVVAEVDPALPVDNLITMEDQVRENVYLDRLTTALSAAFAGLAVFLAAVGVYGVLAYNVTQRTRELGLRLALGATSATLRSLVLKQVGLMAAIGGAIGLLAAVVLGRAAEGLLFGLSGNDPTVLIASIVVLAVVVLAAAYVPARRAARIAPMEALRYE